MREISCAFRVCRNALLTASAHLPPGQAFAEEKCGGAGRAERREEREDGRV